MLLALALQYLAQAFSQLAIDRKSGAPEQNCLQYDVNESYFWVILASPLPPLFGCLIVVSGDSSLGYGAHIDLACYSDHQRVSL